MIYINSLSHKQEDLAESVSVCFTDSCGVATINVFILILYGENLTGYFKPLFLKSMRNLYGEVLQDFILRCCSTNTLTWWKINLVEELYQIRFATEPHNCMFKSENAAVKSRSLWLQLKDGIVAFQERISLSLFEVFAEPTDVSLLNSRDSC